MKLNIALLAGGNSSERNVSLDSAAQVEQALDTSKYNIYKIDLHGRDWNYTAPDGTRVQVDKNDFSLTLDGRKIPLEYALILIHGTPGEDGKLQGYLEMMDIPCSSCDMVSSVITFDKISCKRAVADMGIPLAREIFVKKGDTVEPAEVVRRFGLPLFIKPNASGSSFGVTKVKKEEEILPALEVAFRESSEVLIEEFIEGREIGCGVMIAGGKEYVFPVTELVSKRDFFDYEAKYTAGLADEITPADLKPEVTRLLNEMTLKAYKACRCRGVVRIDFIVRNDTPYMIEINTIPGMSAGSIVPKQVRAMGMTLGQLFDIIIENTCTKK